MTTQPAHEKTRPVHVAKQNTERAESNTHTKEQIQMNSTAQSTRSPRHPEWCDTSRCLHDPFDGTRVHVSAERHTTREHPEGGYELTSVLYHAEGEQGAYADLRIAHELLSAANIRQLITDLQAVERELAGSEGSL